MLGRDVNSSPLQYRVWIVDDSPDLSQERFYGPKSGSLPLVDITTYMITDDSIVDFNLPIPNKWKSTLKVLPDQLPLSHIAVLDGYIYLFGGAITDVIYKASINNPADFIDTGARLPTPLYNGSLAVINDTIYIFGGDNSQSTKTIFSAPVNDPLNWVNHGDLLPKNLCGSSLAIYDGYVYLFGGYETNHATSSILRASVTDPLTWLEVGSISTALYNSHIAIIGDNIYLFGGQSFSDNPTDTIYIASVNDPLNWSLHSYLPYKTSFGNFFTIGDSGYLIAPMAKPNSQRASFTNILKCNLSSPGQWSVLDDTVPGDLSAANFAIVYDRLWLYGGNGQSAIFACQQENAFVFQDPEVISYSLITRELLTSIDSKANPFQILCFPVWKTSYSY